MLFTADLHIHSKYSRATSMDMTLENIFKAALIKGVNIVGTGDFTHPAWFSEIQDKLIPAESGLYKLRDDIETECLRDIPDSCNSYVRFAITSEISNIYRKFDITRKNHNIIVVPDINVAGKFIKKLEKSYNLVSDGRPILGLDTRDMFEMLLDISDESILIPAHVWTPWFSLFGSKSGFDSIEECFGDLKSMIFALETGLSSDPYTNRNISEVDGKQQVSFSDAHSPSKIGREATVFDTDLSFRSIREAIKKGDGIKGTFEFYPQEGKYHLDGHRKCGVRMTPEESCECGYKCPVCGKALTLGVLNRIQALSSYEDNKKYQNFKTSTPLTHILSAITGVGENTKKVKKIYDDMISSLGNELDILFKIPLTDIKNEGFEEQAKLIGKIRTGRIKVEPGFDGEFGKIVLK